MEPEPKVALIVLENRPFIPTDYTKFLTRVAWKRMVTWIRFWGEMKQVPIWKMRQSLIRDILAETDCTHVLWIDSDVIPNGDDFLGRLLAWGKPAISGVYFDAEDRPINRKDGKPYNFLGEGLAEVDVFSMGLSLIRRDVLERVPYPEPTPIWKPDADVEWCGDIRKAGFTIYTDMSIVGTHFFHSYFDGKRMRRILEKNVRTARDGLTGA